MRKCDLERNTRETGSCTDIHNPVYFVHIYGLHTCKAVQKVLYQHFLKFCDSGQIHDFVFFNQIFIKCNKLLFLHLIQGNAKFLTSLFEYLQIISQYFFPPLSQEFLLYCSRYTRSTEISAGDTPEIRDACPMEIGRYASSFCLASIRRLPTFS